MTMDQDAKNKGPRACATCAKAKARCVPGPDGHKCERCHRLDKSCSSQTPAPPRPKKEPKPTRISELERRLEDLTARLEAGTGASDVAGRLSSLGESGNLPRVAPAAPAPGTGTAAEPTSRMDESELPGALRHARFPFPHLFPGSLASESNRSEYPVAAALNTPPESTESTPPATSGYPHNPYRFHQQIEQQHQQEQQQRRAAASIPTDEQLDSLWPHGAEADALLAEYREGMQELFPFVVTPPHLNARELKEQRPFLWKAVMMEACHLDGARQVTLGNELLADIGLACLTRPHKSLDLLQGLQVTIAWFHYNINSFQMTNLLYLMRAICLSLGLSDWQKALRQQEPTSGTLEELRALAGCYYLTTVVFATNKRPDALMYSDSLDAACRVLDERREYPTDEPLVYFIKAQQLSQSISVTLSVDNVSLQTMQVPLSIVVKSFQAQIDNFKASLPPHMQSNHSLMAHIYVAEILLYEIAIPQSQSTGASQMPFVALSPTDRIELLWNCLKATRGFFSVRFDRPVTDRPRWICMTSFDCIFTFLTTLKLITIVNLPGWDLGIVRREVGFAALIERQASDMEIIAARRRSRRFDGARSSAGRATPASTASATGSVPGYARVGARAMTVGDVIVPIATAATVSESPEDPFVKLARRLRTLQALIVAQLENEDLTAAAAAAQQLCAGVRGSAGSVFCEIHDRATSARTTTGPAGGAGSLAPAGPSRPTTTGTTTPMQVDGGAAGDPAMVVDFAQDLVNDLDGTNWQDLVSLTQDAEGAFAGQGLPLSAWGY